MFKKGTYLFSIATVFLFILAFLHTVGISNQPVDPEGLDIIERMKNYSIDMVFMETNLFNIQTSLGLSITIFLVLIAVINTIIANSGTYLVHKISGVNAFFMWAIVGMYYYFEILAPLTIFGLAALLFTITYFATFHKVKERP